MDDMERKKIPFLLTMLLVVILAPRVSLAIPVNVYHSPGDDGGFPSNTGCPPEDVAPVCLGEGTYTINLWADPTSAAGGGTYGIQDVLIQASGSISVASFACDSGTDCIAGIPGDPTTQVFFTAGDDIDGDFAPFEIGTVSLIVGPGVGKFQVVSGTALGGDFVGGNIDLPVVVAQAIPEPRTACLLALGVLGLGFAGRRRVSA